MGVAAATTAADPAKVWSEEETQLLVKGVNMFPAGTANRWEVIASFIVQHASNSPLRSAKEVLQKAKALQKMDSVLKEEANKNAYQTFAAGASAKSNESKKATEEKKVENQA